MHDTAMTVGRSAIEIYGPHGKGAILEIGSYDVNGSLRAFINPDIRYIGVDTSAGPNVDIVVKPGKPLPLDDNAFDLVLASSVLEHDPIFWMTFLEMVRKTRKGGYIYINSPSNGAFHRYPQDNWRFYPDSGHALATWANSQGFDVALIESFIAKREHDIWNDFVAVFRRGPSKRKPPTKLLYESVAATNVRRGKSNELINFRDRTEDMELLGEARVEKTEIERELQKLQSESSQQDHELHESETRLAEAQVREQDAAAQLMALRQALDDQVGESSDLRLRIQQAEQTTQELSADLARKDDLIAESSEAVASARDRIASLESELRQRQEETVQAGAELARARERIAALEADLGQSCESIKALEGKLVEADEWVFRLAGDRRTAEQDTAAARGESARLRKTLSEQIVSLNRLVADVEALRCESADGQKALDDAQLTVRHREEERDSAIARIASLISALGELERLRAEEKAKAESRIAERFAETAALTCMLREHEERSERELAKLHWIREYYAVQEFRRWWWPLMGRAWERQRLYRSLKARGLFDADGYLARYPDVSADGMDSVRHYILHGLHEGRSPAV